MTKTEIKWAKRIQRMEIHSIDTPLSLDEMEEYEKKGWTVSHCEDLHDGPVFKGRCYIMDREID